MADRAETQAIDVSGTAERFTAAPATPARSWRTLLVASVLLAAVLGVSAFGLDIFALQVLSQAFFFAIVVITVDLLWGYTGILTFGQSAFFGIGMYTLAIALAYYVSGVLAGAGVVLGAMAFAALIGALIGWLSFWDRASPIYVAIVTLSLPVVFTQVILSGGAFTGSSSGLPIPVPLLSFEQWYWISGGLLLLLAMTAYVFATSDAGRILVAIRENEERCRYLGLKTSRWKIALMAGCSAVAALAGAGYVLFASVASPPYGDFVFGTELLVWTALGGRGTLVGPILGAIGINYVSAVLGGNLPFVWLLIVGVVFVLVVVYLPNGLVTPILRGVARLVRSLWSGRKAPGRGAEWGEQVAVATALTPRPEPSRLAPTRWAVAEEVTAVELRAVTKRYGSLEALKGITFQARRGEVVGIVGPNGAGKTTLLRCLSDGRERTSGQVIVNGRRVDGLPPQECVAVGIGRKFQTPTVFEALTVLDCLRVARSYRAGVSVWRSSRTLELPEAAVHAVKVSGLGAFLHQPAGHLPHGMKQALELAMVLALEPSVLLLDEPTAGLTRDERAAIGTVLTELAESHRLCILLIEHDLDFVRNISTRLVVLHMGEILLDGPISEVAEAEAIRTIYVGGRAMA